MGGFKFPSPMRWKRLATGLLALLLVSGSVTYGAESSENLRDWTPVSLEVITSGTTETVRATDPLTTGNTALRYLRLRFIRQ